MNSRSTRCIALCALLGALVSPAAVGVGTGGTGLRLAYVRGMLAASGGHVAIGGVAFSAGTASITINGTYGKTINASMVFGPGVTTIDIQGSKQVPTLISMDPSYKYAIIAPAAHITYNGNTAASIEGYIVANRFSGNDNNSSEFTIRNGGLLTLDPSSNSCDLGQSDLYIYLPERTSRPVTTRFFTYRRYVMSYAGYRES
jgi:hypothetical protein